jgi:uncharacterized protein YuzE
VKYTYDDEADALYVHLQDEAEDLPVARSLIVDEGRVLDVAADGEFIGIEVLGASFGVHVSDLAERFGLMTFIDHLKRLEEVRFQALADA